MPGSTIGQLFKISTFGESHGTAVGVVVEGVTPGLEIDMDFIQSEMNRRKPGQSDIVTPRQESDQIHILSGIFEGKATGTPLAMVLWNKDMRSEDYDDISAVYRPGHADYSYDQKYGIRDYRGSGRASGRETAGRVAAGALAKLSLRQRGVSIQAYTIRAAGIHCNTRDMDAIERNPVRACDMEAAAQMERRIAELAKMGDSTGGIVECRIQGLSAGLGEPVFNKIDALLAQGMLSLGAVKGIEFGSGFACADLLGSEHNDWMNSQGFETNNAGGMLGGISTGNEIVFRIVVKPTSSVSVPQKSINKKGQECEVRTQGRHDPCICPRIIPVVEAMAAIILEDLYKQQAALHA